MPKYVNELRFIVNELRFINRQNLDIGNDSHRLPLIQAVDGQAGVGVGSAASAALLARRFLPDRAI